ncbi:PREDICTED: failed axon connections-like isoform X1 [Priapulus caudatus]|uniref:Failed axon connections-like isoform X1 n=2 Tax=Priapulus caudatus TaxID=37621 RepID=A0ABM1EH91_PRICU|nr:PREDICTED: failed axon connections-like isoform X1 [Priapulus caudatus]
MHGLADSATNSMDLEAAWRWCKDIEIDTRVLVGLGAMAGGLVVWRAVKGRTSAERPLLTKNYEHNKVYVYSFPGNPKKCGVVHFSPFTLKVETWLRMNNIKYELIVTQQMSTKKQWPWIELNGKEYSDSNFIIKKLADHFHSDIDGKLTSEQLAVSFAFKEMMEVSFAFTYAFYRYYVAADVFWSMFSHIVPAPMSYLPACINIYMMKKYAFKTFWMAGIARHSKDEYRMIVSDQIHAISNFLGTKKFLMGDNPTSVDAWMFCHLSQVVYVPLDHPHREIISKECPNVQEYTNRVRDTFWPDWNTLFTKAN